MVVYRVFYEKVRSEGCDNICLDQAPGGAKSDGTISGPTKTLISANFPLTYLSTYLSTYLPTYLLITYLLIYLLTTCLFNMAPQTPSPRPSRRQKADTIRKARFFHAIDTRQAKSLKTVIKEKGLPHSTGFNWLRQRRNMNVLAQRRAGKNRIDRSC